MEYSFLQHQRANRVTAINSLNNANKILKATDCYSCIHARIGGMRVIENHINYMEAITIQYATSMAAATNEEMLSIGLVTQVFTALESFLSYNASISLSPTKSARVAYLWFFTIASAYSWITPATSITGTKDSWNWDTKHVLSDDISQFVWMTHVLIAVMPTFIPSFDTSTLLSQERAKFGWSEEQQNAEWISVQSQGNYTEWKALWDTWYSGRQADGNVAASVAPTNAELPNGATRLDVTSAQDFTNATTYPQARQWTPLIVGGAVKNFLTYGWGDVTSTCLSGSDETAVKASADTAFLGTTPARDAEIDDLVTVTSGENLTDTQKVIAEFWAGGPSTVSPPCMMVWFWKKYIEITGKNMHTMIYSGLELSINIFEGSRLTWALKRAHMEARPIQEIRRKNNGQTLIKYDGTSIDANLWVPYQESNFVTPPFADFPSGHSTFSQAFANVMNAWFSPSIPTTRVTMTDLNLLSPIFTTAQENSLTDIMINKQSSKIQIGVVPTTDIHLTWSVWQDIADQAGISRQYGGIHCVSADNGGKLVANGIFPVITTKWNISRI